MHVHRHRVSLLLIDLKNFVAGIPGCPDSKVGAYYYESD